MSVLAPPKRAGNPNWVPGVSGNPKGRPRTGLALTEMIRERVPLPDIVRGIYAIAMGEPAVRDLVYLRERARCEREGLPPPPIEGVEVVWPSQAERLRAWELLAQWGYQKPVQQLEVSGVGKAALDYSKLSDEELDALEALQLKAAGIIDVG